jgi:predicted RNase H-like nuclease (RuvC/YqgF family)
MKLHSDSVIDKLEDKEKECEKLEKKVKEIDLKISQNENHWRIEIKSKEEENFALKRALENKIDALMLLEK